MARDTARLTGRSIMPSFSLICTRCKRTYFVPGGGDARCPECDSPDMVSMDKSPTIFSKDVGKRKRGKKPKED